MLALKKIGSSSLLIFRKSFQPKWSRTFLKKTKDTGFTSRVGSSTKGSELQYLVVNTSYNRWDDIPTGVAMDVGYYDTVKNINNMSSRMNKSFKIVMALHDTPGSHEDVSELLQPFVASGYRVIAPNFPGFGITNGVEKIGNYIFTHSISEKVELVHGLLETLSIDNVDVLIACGSSADVALSLAANKGTGINIKSLVLINPWPHKIFKLFSSNLWMYSKITEISDFKTLRILMWPVLYMLKMSLNPDFKSVRDFVHFCYTVSEIDYLTVRGNIKTTALQKIPRMIVYSEDESFLEQDIIKEYVDAHGMKLDQAFVIDNQGQIIQGTPQKDNLSQTVLFKCGQKELLPKHTKELNSLIKKFNDKVQKFEL